MNLKLKRLVRTQNSEQYALFDLSQLDAQQQPMTIGKLDLHYTGEGIYATILLWDELSRRLRPNQRQKFIHALLEEISAPMGVPNEYVIEFFTPSLDQYELFHNLALDEDDAPVDDLPAGSGQSATPADPVTDAGQDGAQRSSPTGNPGL